MLVIITYDLNRVKDYPKLYSAIEKLGDIKRDPGLDSVWFVYTNSTVNQIQDYLRNYVDSDDCFFISKIDKSYASGYLSTGMWDWIKNRS